MTGECGAVGKFVAFLLTGPLRFLASLGMTVRSGEGGMTGEGGAGGMTGEGGEGGMTVRSGAAAAHEVVHDS